MCKTPCPECLAWTRYGGIETIKNKGKVMAYTSKSKGNAYERKVAKELSIWMFNDQHLLKRKSDSGMIKENYCGDVFPEGQLPVNWKGVFPFLIECKSGYPQHHPTFWKYKMVEKWFNKAYKESLINKQSIIFLICQFKNQRALLITNELLDMNNILFNVAFPIVNEIEEDVKYGYVYNYNELLKLDFYKIFDLNILV